MRVVVDTNVLISGIFWRGKPGRFLEALAAGLFTLCVSVPILDEYLEVIDCGSQPGPDAQNSQSVGIFTCSSRQR